MVIINIVCLVVKRKGKKLTNQEKPTAERLFKQLWTDSGLTLTL